MTEFRDNGCIYPTESRLKEKFRAKLPTQLTMSSDKSFFKDSTIASAANTENGFMKRGYFSQSEREKSYIGT